MRVAYFVCGGGECWALIRLIGRDREEIVAGGLSREAAEELCFAKLEELHARRADIAAAAELPLGDIAPRPRQLSLKL